MQTENNFVVLISLGGGLTHTGDLNDFMLGGVRKAVLSCTLDVKGKDSDGRHFGPLIVHRHGLYRVSLALYLNLAYRVKLTLVLSDAEGVLMNLEPAHSHDILVDHEPEYVGDIAFEGFPGQNEPVNWLLLLEHFPQGANNVG